jgi:hypothetical protein
MTDKPKKAKTREEKDKVLKRLRKLTKPKPRFKAKRNANPDPMPTGPLWIARRMAWAGLIDSENLDEMGAAVQVLTEDPDVADFVAEAMTKNKSKELEEFVKANQVGLVAKVAAKKAANANI